MHPLNQGEGLTWWVSPPPDPFHEGQPESQGQRGKVPGPGGALCPPEPRAVLQVEAWGPFDLAYGSTPPLGHACSQPPGKRPGHLLRLRSLLSATPSYAPQLSSGRAGIANRLHS